MQKATMLVPVATLAADVRSFRSKATPAFERGHPWREEAATDEYYFDVTCYSVWRTAAALMPKDYAKRDEFARNVGRRVLDEILRGGMISREATDSLRGGSGRSLTLVDAAPCVVEVLDLFMSTGYCSGYRLGDENDKERQGSKAFDALDDEELAGGGTVDCLVSVYDPATLGGALQITGEGSRFAPDFVGPTLAAVWERVGAGGDGGGGSVTKVGYESYFVDPVYRPNPKDFFPNERFYQFAISRK
ncbi:hypothetical protein ACHAWF_005523 [Thalassiosira exigua]